MPNPRTPTRILKLRGAIKKNPKRFINRKNEPVPNAPLGDPPNFLSDDERTCWLEFTSKAPFGLLSDCDGWEVEMASCLMAEYRSSRATMQAARLNLLHSILSRFGFTPADRSKISIPKPDEDSKWDF